MTTMNLIIAKNEFDPYDAMIDQLAIDIFKSFDRYISSENWSLLISIQ